MISKGRDYNMNLKRIDEIQQETVYPDSKSVQQALLKVWNECVCTVGANALPKYITVNDILVKADMLESVNIQVLPQTNDKLYWGNTSTNPMTWDNAVAYAKNYTKGGYTDWRLPTIKELITLIDYTVHTPASNDPEIKSEHYWSSTVYAHSSSGGAWFVHFYNGYVNSTTLQTSRYYVRCVRSGPRIKDCYTCRWNDNPCDETCDDNNSDWEPKP